jgi:Ca2+-binding EF-hand superfamily protein
MDSLIDDMFLVCDENRDGSLQKEEIQEFMELVLNNMQDHKLDKNFFRGKQVYSANKFKDFFSKYDKDKSGSLDKKEMKMFC